MRLDWHEDFIVQLASVVRPKVYVELGIYHCALFNRIIPLAEHDDDSDFTWINDLQETSGAIVVTRMRREHLL